MSNFSLYLQSHRHACQEAWHYLKMSWLGSMTTLLVIALALALPWGLLLVSRYMNTLFDQWNHQAQIVLYLQPNLPQKVINDLKIQLQAKPQVASVHYISPAQGLAQLARREGFNEVIGYLDQNPLPAVLEVEPRSDLSPQEIDTLAQQLHQLPLIDQDQININAIKEFYTLLMIIKRMIFALAVLFGVAVILIIGNTLRLIILQRMEEIRVMTLVGASVSYIRRPYLYIGLMLGGFGGLLACALVSGFFSYLDIPLQQLSGLQGLGMTLQPGILQSSLFLFVCCLLGWLSAVVCNGVRGYQR